MKFPYFKLATDIYRPIIPISVSYSGGNFIKYFALVDSGADKCYFASEIASVLGIKNLENGRKEDVIGVNGKSEAYFHPVIVMIGGWKYNIEVGFMKNSSLTAQGYGIFGHKGVFDNFSIKFTFLKKEIEFLPPVRNK